ncbi:MAG TPA: M56 family metallopeptidase [Terriglobales bacterium]
MISLASWLSPQVIRPLGLALLHFLWQGLALAAVAAAGMALCRRASARYAIGVAVLALMVAAPLVTFFMLRDVSPLEPAPAVVMAPAPRPAHAIWPSAARLQPATRLPGDALIWLVQAWIAGVALLSLRMTGGFLLVQRMRRREASPFAADLLQTCADLQRRLRLNRAIRYCTCRWLGAPAVIGWIRPIVFLPLTALTGLSQEQLRAVIAHELAHVKRFDSFVNLFQVATETLLFYHPAVWWLGRRIRQERENCCDDMAVSVCGNTVAYARALAAMAEWQVTPAMALAATGGSLAVRIRRLLGINKLGGDRRGLGMVAGLASVTVAIVIAAAIFGGVRAAAPAQSQTPAPASQTPVPGPSPKAKPSPSRSPHVTEEIQGDSYIERMKAAGLENLDVDQLVALKVQGVTPEYVRDLRAAGLPLTVDQVVGFKVQGITPEYVQEIQKLGVHGDADELIGMKVQGVTPQYISDMRALGLDLKTDEIIGMKVQGVTPDYIRELRSLGLGARADHIVGMKVQGVTPEYVRGIQAQGLHPTDDEVIGMKVQGVTPEYVRDMRGLGLTIDTEQVIGLRVQGVTPQYAKALQAAGLKLDADDLVSAKIHGITPEFVEKVRSHGFKDVDLHKLIQIKQMGILEEPADI